MKITAEQHFKNLISDCISKVDLKEYPNSIFYFKNDKFMFYQDIKTDIFWLSYDRIWSVLETEYDLNYQQIRDLTKGILEEHFKCKVETTEEALGELISHLEEHFKCKVETTLFRIVNYPLLK